MIIQAQNFANGVAAAQFIHAAAAAKNAIGSCLPGAADKNRAGKPNNTFNVAEDNSGQGDNVAGASSLTEGTQSSSGHAPVDGAVGQGDNGSKGQGAETQPGQGDNEAGTPPKVEHTGADNQNTSVATNNGSEGQGVNGAVTPTSTTLSGQGDNGAGAVGDSAVGQGDNGSEGQGSETQLGQGDNGAGAVVGSAVGAGAVEAHDQVETKSSLWNCISSLSLFSSCYANCANTKNDSNDSNEISFKKNDNTPPTSEVHSATGASILSRETSMSA